MENLYLLQAIDTKRRSEREFHFFKVCCWGCHHACECGHILASSISFITAKRVYSKRKKASHKFDHNFDELYVDSDIRNNFQCIS